MKPGANMRRLVHNKALVTVRRLRLNYSSKLTISSKVQLTEEKLKTKIKIDENKKLRG